MNRIVPLILAVALFMEQMDSTVISTALPAIASDLGVGPITLKLALTAYMVALAIFIPVSGWMADRYGAKRVFRLAIVVFMVGSVCCAISSSLLGFVMARFLQGMGGAMMTPVGRLVLLRTTKRSELVNAMALLTIPALVGPLAGPPLGGFITTFFTWHWIFLINIPVGVVGLWLTGVYLPEVPATSPPPLDIGGLILTALAAAGIVFGLSVISLPALPPAVGIVSTLTGFGCGFAYILHWKRHPAAIVDLGLFRNATFRVATLGGSIFRISIGAIPFLMPLMLQLGFGLNPFESGTITFAGAIGAITTKFIAPRVFASLGFRTTLLSAAAITCVATAVNGFFTPQTPHLVIIGFLLVAGFSRSFFFTGVNALSYADIPDDKASQATSLGSVLQQISLALGVAFAALVLDAATVINGTTLQLADFHIAFWVIAIVALLGAIPIITMDRHAGAAVSGHRRAVIAEPEKAAAD